MTNIFSNQPRPQFKFDASNERMHTAYRMATRSVSRFNDALKNDTRIRKAFEDYCEARNNNEKRSDPNYHKRKAYKSTSEDIFSHENRAKLQELWTSDKSTFEIKEDAAIEHDDKKKTLSEKQNIMEKALWAELRAKKKDIAVDIYNNKGAFGRAVENVSNAVFSVASSIYHTITPLKDISDAIFGMHDRGLTSRYTELTAADDLRGLNDLFNKDDNDVTHVAKSGKSESINAIRNGSIKMPVGGKTDPATGVVSSAFNKDVTTLEQVLNELVELKKLPGKQEMSLFVTEDAKADAERIYGELLKLSKSDISKAPAYHQSCHDKVEVVLKQLKPFIEGRYEDNSNLGGILALKDKKPGYRVEGDTSDYHVVNAVNLTEMAANILSSDNIDDEEREFALTHLAKTISIFHKGNATTPNVPCAILHRFDGAGTSRRYLRREHEHFVKDLQNISKALNDQNEHSSLKEAVDRVLNGFDHEGEGDKMRYTTKLSFTL